ncbi:hypothetical protein L6164_004808 [Bauhinia variegata]|uniref:Uncharacterized protein n=1 Tax=Bauhinia variegata TaxID=167791 RepID=A0ACB9PR96_BAUVA|nr:hypothetical protein L6164_004808 [Bauhinia variegata]
MNGNLIWVQILSTSQLDQGSNEPDSGPPINDNMGIGYTNAETTQLNLVSCTSSNGHSYYTIINAGNKIVESLTWCKVGVISHFCFRVSFKKQDTRPSTLNLRKRPAIGQ